jgi:4-diphosphocytidyl-2C-methyl-D-erythritol kinase
VPFRNAHFLAVAVSWAEVLGADKVYIGAVEPDSSGYPDCRPAYYRAFNEVVKAGTKDGAIEIVTPLIAVSTPDVFAAFDAIRTHGDGAVRMSSTHLAEELRSGLTADNLVARAGVLASANDLLPATSLVVPALLPFKRALSRLLGRPIGLSGSGPTLWALYPSETDAAAAADVIREALADGRIDPPGSGHPLVVASSIISHSQEGSAA